MRKIALILIIALAASSCGKKESECMKEQVTHYKKEGGKWVKLSESTSSEWACGTDKDREIERIEKEYGSQKGGVKITCINPITGEDFGEGNCPQPEMLRKTEVKVLWQ